MTSIGTKTWQFLLLSGSCKACDFESEEFLVAKFLGKNCPICSIYIHIYCIYISIYKILHRYIYIYI